MSITLLPTYPFYEGVGNDVDTPARWDVALNGRGYMIDAKHPAFKEGLTTLPLIRQQADNSEEPGEATLNREDLWGRSQSSWHKGAGQEYLDAPDSDRMRFRRSLGIDCWTRGTVSLLPATTKLVTSANTNLRVLRVGSYLYYCDGTALQFANTPYSSFSDSSIQAGESAVAVSSITSDGYNVWASLGANGVHTTTRGATSSSHYNALNCSLLAYVKGRLMAAASNSIYNITASGAAPSALYTQPNTDFTWVGFAEGLTCIYAAGFSGDKSLIYRTAVKADGTALDVPVIAGELPDGEIVRSIQGYLGFVILGTDIGYRLATQDGDGNLTLGALVRTDTAVRCFEPQERFVWFGWENFDATHSGLGRLDLTAITDAGAAGYASDLMAVDQGAVLSVMTDSTNKRVFAVSGKGIYVEGSSLVSSGYFDSGQIGFGIPDPKIALRLALKHKPLETGASVTVSVAADSGELVPVGESSLTGATGPTASLKVPEMSGQLFEVRITLTGTAELERYDFRAYPVSQRGRVITVPLLLHEFVLTATGQKQPVDVRREYDSIEGYVGTRQLISYQELGSTFSVLCEGGKLERWSPTEDRSWWNGTFVVQLKVLGD